MRPVENVHAKGSHDQSIFLVGDHARTQYIFFGLFLGISMFVWDR